MFDSFYKYSFFLNYINASVGQWPSEVAVGALFRPGRLISIAFVWQRKPSVCFVAPRDFCICFDSPTTSYMCTSQTCKK